MATYNVLDFGATGNGVTDDTAAIQAAVNAARADGGGTVYIPEGTFIVTGHTEPSDGAIMLYDNITLTGAGMGLTNIKVADGWDMKMTGVIRTPYGAGTENVTVNNLTIDGNRDNVNVKIDGWFNGYAPGKIGYDSNITLDRVEIKDCSGYGFDPHEQTLNLSITNSIAHGNGLDGFVADYIVGGVYANNIAYNNDRHGFNLVTNSSDLIVSNNIAYDNGGNGIVAQRGSENLPWPKDLVITGNEVYNNALEGVLIKLANYVTLSNNNIHDNGKAGVRLYGTDNNTLFNNTITNNSTSKPGSFEGIRIEPYDDTNGVSGNYYYTTLNTITGNTIDAGAVAAYYGIREAVNGDFNTITGNTIVNFKTPVSLSGANSSWDMFGQIDYSKDNNLMGTVNSDTINGLAGNDTINGGAGRDTLTGGEGNDVFKFTNKTHSTHDNADKIMDFVAGVDKIDVRGMGFTDLITSTNPTLINELRIAYSSTSNTTYVRNDETDFEVALVGDQRTTLTASSFIFDARAGEVFGTTANDTLLGTTGNDTIDGGAGRDTMTGGLGVDVFRFSSLTDSRITGSAYDRITDFQVGVDKIDLTGLGFTALTGNKATIAGELRLSYSATTDRTYVKNGQNDFSFYFNGDMRGKVTGADFIFSKAPTATPLNLVGNGSNETFYGDTGNDTIKGNGGNDTIHAGAGADSVNGGSGHDFIYGGDGNDTLLGNDGFDFISGGAGNDRIYLMTDTDTAEGGAGGDIFSFQSTSGVVNDFNIYEDVLDLRTYIVTKSDLSISTVGTDTVIDIVKAGAIVSHITLTGITADTLLDTDFIF